MLISLVGYLFYFRERTKFLPKPIIGFHFSVIDQSLSAIGLSEKNAYPKLLIFGSGLTNLFSHLAPTLFAITHNDNQQLKLKFLLKVLN